MKTLPKIPSIIPATVVAESKKKGLIYVGQGTADAGIFGGTRESAYFFDSYLASEGLLWGDSMRGNGTSYQYFVAPAVAAKYFTITEKTAPRGPNGRFLSTKVPELTSNVKDQFSQKLAAYKIEEIDSILSGRVEMLGAFFTWSMTPQGWSYWDNVCYKRLPLSPIDIKFLQNLRDYLVGLAAETAKREEEEKKVRLPKVGEVWHSDYTNSDYLAANVAPFKAFFVSVTDGNRFNDEKIETESGVFSRFPKDGPFTFVAASLQEYFKKA